MTTQGFKLQLFQEYLDKAVRSYEFDQPDTPYQHGYLDALREVQKQFDRITIEKGK